MAIQYELPLPVDFRLEYLTPMTAAAARWGKAAAIRVEDVGTGVAVFRPRYRVGYVKVGSGATRLFIEVGAGDSFEKAFADADLRTRPEPKR